MAGLRRLATAQFMLDKAFSLEQTGAMNAEERDQSLLPVDSILESLPKVSLDDTATHFLLQGQAVWQSGINLAGFLRLYSENGDFLGIGEQADDGKIAPKRLVTTKQ